METYPPTFNSIALQKNQIDLCFDDSFPFFVFLRTPSHYDFSFEVKQTENISKAIEFISPKINVKSENIVLLNIKTKEKIDNSSTFVDFEMGDIILVSHDGQVPDDDVPELPPEIGEVPSESAVSNLPPPSAVKLSTESNPDNTNKFEGLVSTPNDEQETVNSDINMNGVTLSDIRRMLTQKQKDFISGLVSTYGMDEGTVSQIFLINDKNEALTEELISQMCS